MGGSLSKNKPKKRRWRRRLWVATTTGLILLLLFIAVQFTGPVINNNHQRIEAWVSREMGHQVRFEQMQLRWDKLSPVVVLKDFAIKSDEQAQDWMQVERMQFAINWWKSLIRRELRLGKWLVRGADIDLQHVTISDQEHDLQALFQTIDKWLGKNPVSARALTIRAVDANQQSVSFTLDEIDLTKQPQPDSPINKPQLKPWLVAQQPEKTGKKQKVLTVKGKAHIAEYKHARVQFVLESSPYSSHELTPTAKIYLDLKRIPLHLLPEKQLPIKPWLGDNEFTGKIWIDLQDGQIAAMQTVFRAESPNSSKATLPTPSIAGHIYALKDAKNGWWITADEVELKTPKNKPIQGKFALQFRDADPAGIDWLVRVPQFNLTQGNASLTGQLQWHQPMQVANAEDNQGYFKLNAQAHDFPLQQLLQIIPQQVLPQGLSNWLQQAPQSGKLQQTQIDIEGAPAAIRQGSESAKISGQGAIEGLKLRYHPLWPSVKADRINFTLNQDQLILSTLSAQSENNRIDKLSVVIDGMFNPDRVACSIDLRSKLTLEKVAKFIQKSPLQTSVGRRLSSLKLAGPAALNVQVNLPLHQQSPASVKGKLTFDKAGLQLKQMPIIINQLTGSVDFTEASLSASKLTGQLWGEPIQLKLTTDDSIQDYRTHVSANTTLALPTLARVFPAIDKLPMLGSTDSQIDIAIPDNLADPIKVQMRSDLQGIHVALPPPLGKTTSTSVPTVVKASLFPDSANQYRIEYANQQMVMEVNQISAHAQEWQFAFNSPEIDGQAKLVLMPNQQSLTGQFAKLYIKQNKQPKSADTLNPTLLPTLNISVDDFMLDNKKLGQLTLTARPIDGGQEITKLQTQSGALNIQAKGTWTVQNQQHYTRLQGNFQSKQFKRALRALGIAPSIDNNKTNIDFSLNWPGAPYEFSMAALNGSAYFKMSDGRIDNLSKQTSQMIGIGRMLNMLSVSSIPKRLRLDFSDLTEKGLHFNEFKGNVLILNGDATTNDAMLDGPVSRIRWKGRVGLSQRDYDLIMRIEPHMTSSLPVVAAIAGGPVVGPVAGVATWMMNKAIAPDLERMSSYTYEIKGPWKEPMVRPIDPSRNAYRAPVVDKS